MFEELADNVGVIFAAYVAAFLPWALISSSFDFISPRWKTVSDTWTEGVLVIFYSTIPALYIIFYIVLQALSEDFKEMFAAIVALLFALLYIFRAVWGLWKLHVFRYWVANSIVNLGKLGIMYKSKADSKSMKTALRVADGVFVNDTVIDNQLSSGSCPCYVQYGSHVFKLSSNSQHDFIRRLLVLPTRLLFPLRLCLYVLQDVVSGNLKFDLRLIPEKPVEVWLNWAVTFASQGLEEWIRDFAVAQNPDEIEVKRNFSNAELFEKRQRYFAGEVLASAALQFWPPKTEWNTLSPMVWKIWDEDSDVYDSKISKGEFLRRVIRSGKGLPFDASHESSDEEKQSNLEGYVRSYDYAAFWRQLRRIADGMPAGFGEWIEEFDREKLEWLAILLNMGAYASEAETINESHRNDSTAERLQEEDSSSSGGASSDEEEIVEELDVRDLAVENLVEQLGVEKDTTQSTKGSGVRSLCAFPVPKSCLDRVARSNRLVMRVGEMIDIWCALEAGRQVMFLKEFGEPWDMYCRGWGGNCKCCGKESECEADVRGESFEINRTSRGGEKSASLEEWERVTEANRKVEMARLQYQIAEEKPRYWHMEQTVSFMGYGMEFVRTELGGWKKVNEGSERNVWEAEFGEVMGNGTYESEGVDLGMLSGDMMIGVVHSKGIEHLKKRSVQTRVLWELQQRIKAVYESSCKRGPESLELMILCVLCYPSISVTVEENCGSNVEDVMRTFDGCTITFTGCWESREEEKDGECCYEIVISPECGPQELVVIADLKVYQDRRAAISAKLRGQCADGNLVFMWERWRDSFTARLESARKWQSSHDFMTGGDVSKTEGSIAQDVAKVSTDKAVCREPYYTWTGWLPFRKNMCRFEMESPNLLWQHKDTGERYHTVTSERSEYSTHPRAVTEYIPIPYKKVERQQLRHFNFVVRDATMNDTDRGGQENENQEVSIVERADELLRKGGEHVPRGLFLLETAVTEGQDIDALEKCVDQLVMEEETQDIGRALRVVTNYYSCLLPRDIRRLSAEEQNRMGRIRALMNNIVHKDGYSERSAVAMSEFLMVACCTKMENVSHGLSVMEKLIYRTRSLKLLGDYLSVIGFWIDRGEMSAHKLPSEAICDLLDSLFFGCKEAGSEAVYEFVSKCYWRGIQHGGYVGFKSDLGFHLSKGVKPDPKRAQGLYEDAIREGRHVDAMICLAGLVEKGADGVDVDAVRAKKLYEDAIEEGRDVSAMNNLGLLLVKGGEGVDVDLVRAKKLYEDAIEEGRDVVAMTNLADLLVKGAEGVEVDAIRAKKLYEDAIEEGRDVVAMTNLADLLFKGGEGVEVDAVRAKKLYEDAIEEGRQLVSYEQPEMTAREGSGRS